MKKRQSFTKDEVRSFLVEYFGLSHFNSFGSGKKGIISLLERIGSIQYDPLNVIGTNIDIMLKSRFIDLKKNDFESLIYHDFELIEGIDKEASVFLAKDWPNFDFVRKKSVELNLARLEYRNQLDVLKYVPYVKRIVQASDVQISGQDIDLGDTLSNIKWGSSKISNCVLNHLWLMGEVLISGRNNRKKQYISSEMIKNSMEKQKTELNFSDFQEWYVLRRLNSLGITWLRRGPNWQGCYLQDMEFVREGINKLKEKNLLKEIQIEDAGETFYISKRNYESLASIGSKIINGNLRLIAPLDNFIWDRKMTKLLFDFVYMWEVYKPKEKRKFGYYVLPILYGNRIIGRVEPNKVSDQNKYGMIKSIWFESADYDNNYFRNMVEKEIARISAW